MSPETMEKELLALLLDKYERSAFFKTGARPTRRIMIRLYDSGISDFGRYHIENTEVRRRINRAVLTLTEKGLAYFRWMKGEEDNLIAQVWLNTDTEDAIAAAYTFLRRKPKRDIADEISLEVIALLDKIQSPWMRRFLEDCRDTLTQKLSPGNKLPADNAERKNLFRALEFADKSKPELLERVFSVQCFGDSKIFENLVRKRFIEIIRRYSDCDEDSSDEELLGFAGIVRYPEVFEFRGPLAIKFFDPDSITANKDSNTTAKNSITTNGKFPDAVDFSPLRYGASLSSMDLKRGQVELPANLTLLLSIENKANYINYLQQNNDSGELVVYHGGQFSPSRGAFFRSLAAALSENCPWFHWGDIDYGGFSMLARLRREIRKDVRPYRMAKEDLVKYARLALPVTEAYAEKLRSLTRLEELGDCLPCINYMAENRLRLEQEAMTPPG